MLFSSTRGMPSDVITSYSIHYTKLYEGVDQVPVDRILDQELRLAVVHCHRPERIHRRKLIGRKGNGVVMLASVEGLPVPVAAAQGVHSFLCRITSYNVCYTKLLRDRSDQKVTAVVARAMKEFSKIRNSYNFV